MKPYGRRNEPVKGDSSFKIDRHCHDKNHRKVPTWWEEFSENYIDRGGINHKVREQIKKEINGEQG